MRGGVGEGFCRCFEFRRRQQWRLVGGSDNGGVSLEAATIVTFRQRKRQCLCEINHGKFGEDGGANDGSDGE
uniref:Uncharacterized protein n=1 Tax=Solanum lycopersicum TaxID=4081 RepID=A0A3Q7ER60_SOLLC